MTKPKTKRICPVGHTYFKSSDCPSCPICEAKSKPTEGFLSKLSAPARRALISRQISQLEDLMGYSKKEVASWHGVGPKVLQTLSNLMAINGLCFLDE